MGRYAEILPVVVDSNEKGDAIFEAKANDILKKVLALSSRLLLQPRLLLSRSCLLVPRSVLEEKTVVAQKEDGGRRVSKWLPMLAAVPSPCACHRVARTASGLLRTCVALGVGSEASALGVGQPLAARLLDGSTRAQRARRVW